MYDYWDEWGWDYYGIGRGDLSASVIVPKIEQAKGKDILVRINSGGGSVFEGWAIYNALLNHDAKVIIQIDGISASIASIISMAGSEIRMMRGSLLMIHKPTTSVWMFESMNSDELRKEAETLDKIQKILSDIYIARTAQSYEVINQLINEETWFTPAEALELKFIDSISNGANRATMTQNAFNQIFNNAPARVKAYANSTFKIMAVKTKDNKKVVKENKTLLGKLVNSLKNILGAENSSAVTADGTTFYFDGDLEVGTNVYSDEEMTEALADGDYTLDDDRTMTVADGAVSALEEPGTEEDPTDAAELQNRIDELEAENQELTNQLDKTNQVLARLANVRSSAEPEDRKQNFGKGKKKEEGDFYDAMNERRREIAERNKKK